jgi:hypothetical protein
MCASQALVVVGSIELDMERSSETQPLDVRVHNSAATFRTGGVCAVVAVTPGTVPISEDWLGVESNSKMEVLSNSMEEEARKPHGVSRVDSGRWSALVLPLTWENFSVRTGDVESGM